MKSHTHGQAGKNPCLCDSPPRDQIIHRHNGDTWKHGTRPGDSRIKIGASDTNHPEEPHYGDVGNTINPNTGGYDGF